MPKQSVSSQMLQRLPLYVNYLKSLPCGAGHISATTIAEELGLNDVQVRKDLAAVSSGGRPKIGYSIESLMSDIQDFLEHNIGNPVVIVGMGHLGRALAHFAEFGEYGQYIGAVFDNDERIVGTMCDKLCIKPVSDLEKVCLRLGASIGIITVPEESAQSVCDRLVRGGVRAIWNFAPAHLNVPEGVLVQNENMAVSLAILAKRIPQYQGLERGVG